ncbi:spore coat polysaccharide biosynthesis protein SpsF [Streptosporangium becharense]|uniref:Spore coat polysaccharide biosynthesis protein SpsF n=1 Tax=Streptosporangium becharense TaxID=1816182 RepID=A0A7W9IEZ7_9ACTN|nr:glycosyltransferase family protein [Streptosporangium becharense]MBB2909529.1 spore coat polysaccharide biosynthesis protein SpsF [Streptosporangium becharense]MBB5819514.1 spore coat polysaccharide biosynthesis protein SpsF [Streptosporangium becharense]
MRIIGIVQARMGSTRLPGKVLKDLAGRSVLGWVVRAARQARAVDELVVATTTQTADDAVEAECARLEVACHRGPVDDVLDRFRGVLAGHPGDAVMRLTADCPLLDPEVIREAALAYRAIPGLDYLSTGLPHTLPRGTDVEIVGRAALEKAGHDATGHHRAHVTSYVYTHPGDFRTMGLTYQPDASDLRVTLDTEDDWRLIRRVAEEFGDRTVPVRSLVAWLRARPDVRALNAHVQQKALREA